MSLTFANVLAQDAGAHNFGDILCCRKRVTFDSSYPSGGYSIGATKVDFFSQILGAQLIALYGTPPADFGGIRWNSSANKLRVLSKGNTPPLIIEEVVTVASNAGRLARVPGYIIAVQGLAGSVTGAFRVIPTGKTPATKQVAVNLVTGTMATFSTDAVTSLAVTYIPLGIGQFTEANRVIDEAHTFTTGGANLANRAAVIQYVWNDTDTTHLPAIQPVGEAPATHQIAIDILNSTVTTITPNSAQNTNTGVVTYFKYSSSWLSDHDWTDQASITISSTTLFSIGKDLAVPPMGIFVPGFGNVIVGETASGTTNLQSVIEGPRGTAAANVIVYDPLGGKFVPVVGDAYVTIQVPYIILSAANAVGADNDMPTGALLTGLVADVLFFGL